MESTFVGTVRCALETTLRHPAKSGRADGSASRARQTASCDSMFAGIGSSAARGRSTDERFRRERQVAESIDNRHLRLGVVRQALLELAIGMRLGTAGPSTSSPA